MNKTDDFATQSNAQLDLAYDYVLNTNRNVFLTGKAGTGKTTFLHRLKKQTAKRMAIVAPTGVAAINAGGVTIHSLFQLSFSPFVPNHVAVEPKKYSRDKINLIKSIDLLVIDEISMVRCDVLDAVDMVLRQFRNRFEAFGGVQLLLIGDINQLAPVMKDADWELLKTHYQTVFFFSSHALGKNYPVIVELKHIFRQSDGVFIDLLNQVRNNEMSMEGFALLNSRLDRGILESNQDEGYITLSSHNAMAKQINQDRLEKLSGTSRVYKAKITGDFSEYSFPTDQNLELKIGAQVMFIKNDTAKEKKYFNGKIGRIVKLDSDSICVKTDDFDEILVANEEWNNIKYTLNLESKTIEEKVLGSFNQMPLKLAYAITIHKSQGLTFDKVIIDAEDAFSSGQVYVALSRCRTLEGIILSTPISSKSIRLDSTIHQFNHSFAQQNLDDEALQKDKLEYQEGLIMDLLDYDRLRHPLVYLHTQLLENSPPIDSKTVEQFGEVISKAELSIGKVLRNFQNQIKQLILKDGAIESNVQLNERLAKGQAYFSLLWEELLQKPLNELTIQTDNKAIKEAINKALTIAKQALFIKMACFKYCASDFKASAYAQIKVNAELDFQKINQRQDKHDFKDLNSSQHPVLYHKLRKLRRHLADEIKVEDFKIFTLKALMEISNTLPTTLNALVKVKGIGKKTCSKYGDEIINTVMAYCQSNQIHVSAEPKEEIKPKAIKEESHKISYDLLVSGLSVIEIATQRALAASTINGHLTHYVGQGLLSINQFIAPPKLEAIEGVYASHPELKISEAKNLLGEDYSYEELRFFVSYWKHKLG